MNKDNKNDSENKEKGIFIPDSLLSSTELSLLEKILLAQIKYFGSNGCFSTNTNLGNRLGVSGDWVSKTISKLKNMGYVTVKIEYVSGTKQVKSRTIYTVQKYGRV